MKRLIIVTIFLTVSLFAEDIRYFKTSFDCQKIKKDSTQWAICTDGILAGWDRFMNDVYKFSYTKEKDKELLKNEQLNWIKERNSCRENFNCIEGSYSRRAQVLIDRYVERQVIPNEYIYDLFKKYPIKDCSKVNITLYKTDKLNKEHAGIKKEICKEIKETLWNEKSMQNLKIIKPIIEAKFFEDEKYRDFIHESIKKVNLPIKKSNYFPPSIFFGKDLMVLNSDDSRHSIPVWNGLIKTDMCDIRIYKGEIDGDLENGEEYLYFVGANFAIDYYKDTQRHPGNEALVTLFNLSDKRMKFQKGFMLDATTDCLNYDGNKWLSNMSKPKLSRYLSSIIVYDDYKILFWKEDIDNQELRLEIVDERDFSSIIINKNGEVR